ncbi:MAG: hypothetical protein ACRCWQ_09775 [Bacilli bacterium]
MINITCCSAEFVWSNDWNPEDFGYDPEVVEHVMTVTCPHCERMIDVVYYAPETE